MNIFDLFDLQDCYHIEVGQCTNCFEKNCFEEVHNYVIAIGTIKFKVPIGQKCKNCGEVEFDGYETILPSMGDRAVIASRRHANRDGQAIQARWTKRQIECSLRTIPLPLYATTKKI